MLKKFKVDDLKSIGTPMSSTIKLEKDEKVKDVDQKLFRGMIGSLLYLTASRPNIRFSVFLFARFQSCPKESHLIAIKRIFKCLIGTHSIGLWYPKCDTFDLVGYSDSDFAGTLSTAEAEYIVVGSCVAQILWMKQQLEDFGIKDDHVPIRIRREHGMSEAIE
ncbi:secreted RxLR effector protein 161-like [Hevea brasiliensis]|uniref:secreted RxLR effector protein 161-like n=1 Tax=Hevea brasiliensis TaxID=3981 RepID=UPI0025FD4084|nr:secreted RxLR effector protein 161-like [Hevea brasiliensis]